MDGYRSTRPAHAATAEDCRFLMYSCTIADIEWTTCVTPTIILLGTGILLPLLIPFWMLFTTRTAAAADPARRRARQRAACSMAVAGVMAVTVSDWSLSVHLLNVLAVAIAFAGAGALVVYVFSFKPRPAGIVIGLLGAAGWCLALVFTLLCTAIGGRSPVSANLGGGLYCSESFTGLLPSASGRDIELLQRHLFVDHRLYRGSEAEDNPDVLVPAAPPDLADALARCGPLLDRQRDTQAAVAKPADRAYTRAVAPQPR